jgi:uncharacterized protein (DUF302 family)/uncharacterized membrane protein YidH (DUF202 family)
LRDYLAAERTQLAWIRTGLSLMGFGFVIARFGLALEGLPIDSPSMAVRPFGISFWFGTTLTLAGIVVMLGGTHNYMKQARRLKCGVSTLAVGVAFFLSAAGIAISIYLLSFRPANVVRVGEHRETPMQISTDNGIVSIPSSHSVDEVVERILRLLSEQGVKVFAVIDHSGEAEKAGLSMRPTKVVIFGNPKAGTPLMLASPSAAIDLPLKLLIAQDVEGKVWVSYTDPEYLASRHGLPEDLTKNIAVIRTLAAKVAE